MAMGPGPPGDFGSWMAKMNIMMQRFDEKPVDRSGQHTPTLPSLPGALSEQTLRRVRESIGERPVRGSLEDAEESIPKRDATTGDGAKERVCRSSRRRSSLRDALEGLRVPPIGGERRWSDRRESLLPDGLGFYAGKEGRKQFFDLARTMKERPVEAQERRLSAAGVLKSSSLPFEGVAAAAAAAAAEKGQEATSARGGEEATPGQKKKRNKKGMAARRYLDELEERSLPPRALLARVDAGAKQLNLTSLGLGDEFANALVSGLSELGDFERLSLADNKLTDESLPRLLGAAESMARLKVLDLSKNAIDAAGASALRNFLAAETAALDTLKLAHADIDDDECRRLCESVADNPNSKLSDLDLSENLIGVAEGRNVVTPEYITGGEALAATVATNDTLTRLNLSWNYIRGDSATALARALAANRGLLDLDLSYNGFGDRSTQELGRALGTNKTLTRLNFANNAAPPRAAFVLANELRRAKESPLRTVDFSGNMPGRTGGRALLRAVRDREGSLTITLRNCVFSGTKEQDDFFDAGAPAGAYDLYLEHPYDKMVACELLHLATVRKGCSFAKLSYSSASEATPRHITLVRRELSKKETRDRIWNPVLASIFEEKCLPTDRLLEVLRKCHLRPSPSNVERMGAFVDQRLKGFFDVEDTLQTWITARTAASPKKEEVDAPPKDETDVVLDMVTGSINVLAAKQDEDDMTVIKEDSGTAYDNGNDDATVATVSRVTKDEDPSVNEEDTVFVKKKKKKVASSAPSMVCPAPLAKTSRYQDSNVSILEEKTLKAAASAVRFGTLLGLLAKMNTEKAAAAGVTVESKRRRCKDRTTARRINATSQKTESSFVCALPVSTEADEERDAAAFRHEKVSVGRGKLTHEVVLSLIFRAAFRLVDADGSGKLDAGEIGVCGQVLGLEMNEAETERIVVEFDDGDGLISESDFCAYMLSLFLDPPETARGALLEKSTQVPWTVPEHGRLQISFVADPSVPTVDEIGSDRGVDGLLAAIAAGETEAERSALFELATSGGDSGGYFTAAQAQRVIDLCASREMDAYDVCKRLVYAMASTEDCRHILSVNLTPGQAMALYCELGPACWRWATGNLTGHYAFDLALENDRRDFERLCAAAHVERLRAQKAQWPDTTQHGNWTCGGFRNVRVDRRDWFSIASKPFDPGLGLSQLEVLCGSLSSSGSTASSKEKGEEDKSSSCFLEQRASCDGAAMVSKGARDAAPSSGNGSTSTPKLRAVVSFDLVSLVRPASTDRPVTGLRFQELLKAIHAAEWKDAAKINASEAVEQRRTRAAGSGLGTSSNAGISGVSLSSSPYNDPEYASGVASGTHTGHAATVVLHKASAPHRSLVAAARIRKKKEASASKAATSFKPRTRVTSTSSEGPPPVLGLTRLGISQWQLIASTNYEPVWPARRGHKLQTADNVAAYYSELLDSSVPGGSYFSHPVRMARIGMGAGVGVHADAAVREELPNLRSLSWLHLKLVELELRASRLHFSAEQVLSLWTHLPAGRQWAALRVQLVCILFRRIVDIENLPAVLLEPASHDDVCRLRHRLGPLNLLSARAPDGFHCYALHIWDEHRAVAVLVALAFAEPGENWIDARYRRSHGWSGADWMPGWSLPTSWVDNIIHEGVVECTYVSPVPDWPLRDSLMTQLLAGAPRIAESRLRVSADGTIFKR